MVNSTVNHTLNESTTNLSCGYISLEQSMAKRSMKSLIPEKKKATSEVLRQSVVDMREMGEVVKELTQLVGNIMSERVLVGQQLQNEREMRQQIDQALEKQSMEQLPTELLIMKVTILE